MRPHVTNASQKIVFVRWAEERSSRCGQLSFSCKPTIDTRLSWPVAQIVVARTTGIMQFESDSRFFYSTEGYEGFGQQNLSTRRDRIAVRSRKALASRIRSDA